MSMTYFFFVLLSRRGNNYRPTPIWLNVLFFSPFLLFLQVALRIRPMKHEERSRGFKSIAEKVDERVIFFLHKLIYFTKIIQCSTGVIDDVVFKDVIWVKWILRWEWILINNALVSGMLDWLLESILIKCQKKQQTLISN